MNSRVTYNSFRAPKPEMFVGTLTVTNNSTTSASASGGTLRSWVTSVVESSGTYTVTFKSGVTFPVTPVVTMTAVSTNGTTVKVFPVITQQFTNSDRTLKFKLYLDDGSAATPTADLFTNMTIVGTLNSGV